MPGRHFNPCVSFSIQYAWKLYQWTRAGKFTKEYASNFAQNQLPFIRSNKKLCIYIGWKRGALIFLTQKSAVGQIFVGPFPHWSVPKWMMSCYENCSVICFYFRNNSVYHVFSDRIYMYISGVKCSLWISSR